jgi:N6-adenosine-specific RNA methylase IME4
MDQEPTGYGAPISEAPGATSEERDFSGKTILASPPTGSPNRKHVRTGRCAEMPAFLPSAPQALKALDQLAVDVHTAPSLSSLKAVRNAAISYQREFRKVKEISDKAGEVQIAADVKLAQELDAAGKAVGTRGQFLGGSNKAPPRMRKPVSDAPTLAEIDVCRRWAARARRIAQIPASLRDQYIAELKVEHKAITPSALLIKDSTARKEQIKQKNIQAKFSEDGPFGTVVIDPPWPVEKIGPLELRPERAEFAYATIREDEIIALWNKDVVPRLEPDCHLFMWATNKFLPVALRMIGQVGFRYVLTMVWHKTAGYQPIGLPQYNCEFVVYARRGAPVFVDTKDFCCCFDGERREHSRKPDAFYDMIRRVTGGSRIDIFSRERRDGFAQFGDEINKFSAQATIKDAKV